MIIGIIIIIDMHNHTRKYTRHRHLHNRHHSTHFNRHIEHNDKHYDMLKRHNHRNPQWALWQSLRYV